MHQTHRRQIPQKAAQNGDLALSTELDKSASVDRGDGQIGRGEGCQPRHINRAAVIEGGANRQLLPSRWRMQHSPARKNFKSPQTTRLPVVTLSCNTSQA